MNLINRLKQYFTRPRAIHIEHTELDTELDYDLISDELGRKILLPKTQENLIEVNHLQRLLPWACRLISLNDYECFTAEKAEKTWDLLHETRAYLENSEFEYIAARRCKYFLDSIISGDKVKIAFDNLAKIA